MGELVWVPVLRYHKGCWRQRTTPSTRYFPFLVKWGRDAKLHLCGTEAEVLASISLLVLLQKKGSATVKNERNAERERRGE